jgi:acetate---CoA ligase (ADP-forming)
MSDAVALTAIVARTDWYASLIAPKRVAVVGASADPAKGGLLRNMIRLGYGGEIIPVNPKAERIEGLPTVSNLRSIDGPIDLALIVVPAKQVPEVVRECADAGVSAAYIMSAGFAELGKEGAELENAARAYATKTGLRLLGPNCNGMISSRSSFAASIMTTSEDFEPPLVDDGIAIITQSGAIGAFLLPGLLAAGLGIGTYFSTGNEADVGFEELLGRLVDDSQVRVILTYVEGLRNGSAFVEVAARAQARGKPIVMLKVGVTRDGARASASHTGAMAGSDAVYQGVLHQLGVRRAGTLRQLVDSGHVMSRLGAVGRRLGVVTISGGLAVMSLDRAALWSLEVPAWSETTAAELSRLLPSYTSIRNPLDTSGIIASNPAVLRGVLEAAARDERTDLIIVSLGGDRDHERKVVRALIEIVPTLHKPLIACWVGGLSESGRQALARAAICSFDTVEDAIDATGIIARAADHETRQAAARATPCSVNGDALSAARLVIDIAKANGRGALDEIESKQILRAFEIPCVAEAVISGIEELVEVGKRLRPPYVAKIRSAGLLHKSDVGGVITGLSGVDAAGVAVRRLLERARQLGLTDAQVIVQEQAAIGAELLLGSSTDPTFGAVVSLGMGGVGAELDPDLQIRLPELTRWDVADMLGALRAKRIFAGFRGAHAVNREELERIVLQFAAMVRALTPQVAEIDINPLIMLRDGDGLVAADALFVLR